MGWYWVAHIYMIEKQYFTRNEINITCSKKELNMLYILITQNQINLFFIIEQLKQATYANKDVVVQSKEPKQERSLKLITNR